MTRLLKITLAQVSLTKNPEISRFAERIGKKNRTGYRHSKYILLFLLLLLLLLLLLSLSSS